MSHLFLLNSKLGAPISLYYTIMNYVICALLTYVHNKLPNKLAEVVTLLSCIQEVLSLNPNHNS